MRVSVLVPAHNEVRTLPEVLRGVAQLRGLELEVVVADDGSTDGTAEWLQGGLAAAGLPGRVVRHAARRGKGAALRSALEASTGEVVVIQDADLEYDPAYIPRVVAKIASGEADVVYGSRLLSPESKIYNVVYLWGNMFLTWVINRLCGSRITDAYTGCKAFRRSVLEATPWISRGFDFEAEVSVRVALGGWRLAEIPVAYRARTRAEGKKIRWTDAVKGLWTILATWAAVRRTKR